MSVHRFFYYPYASFTNTQLPLLKVAALWFDELSILDPISASWGTIGADYPARKDLRLLSDAGILKFIPPATVLAKFDAQIAEAIRRDMGDRAFLDLCDAQARATGKQRWSLSLAKVPQNLQADSVMRRLMGDFAREITRESGQFREQSGMNPADYFEYAQGGQVYDEFREGYDADVEYRYADFPLALGESIMMNHALFAGLLHSSATLITDEAFHSRALTHKLQRATQEPAVQEIMLDRERRRRIKAGQLAFAALANSQLRLPVLNPAIPLEKVLEYREHNADALARARATLGRMASQMQSEPWTDDFVNELENEALPDLMNQLRDTEAKRDEWIADQRRKDWVKGSGIALGVATAILSLIAAPVTPVALCLAGMGLASGGALPAIEWMSDRSSGKKILQENGLHFLLEF